MTLIARASTVECDWCGEKATLHHDIDYEGDSGYPFNKALSEAGWSEPWDEKEGYIHVCPKCVAHRPRRKEK